MAHKFRIDNEYEMRNLSLQFAAEIEARIDEVFLDTNSIPAETKSAQSSYKVQGEKPIKKINWRRSSLAYPAIPHIKAGKNGSAIYPNDISPDVIIDEVTINEEVYFLYNCRKEGAPIILGTKVHRWFQVEGNSMNLAEPIPIFDGDYILAIDVHLSNHEARPGDIVTAEIFNTEQSERSGAVKKYTLAGLVSISTEDYRVIREDEFAIQGVVIAIAKPASGLQSVPTITEAIRQAIESEKDHQAGTLFSKLCSKTSGNVDVVVRLIEHEKKKNPNASLNELMQNAIERLEKDKRP